MLIRRYGHSIRRSPVLRRSPGLIRVNVSLKVDSDFAGLCADGHPGHAAGLLGPVRKPSGEISIRHRII